MGLSLAVGDVMVVMGVCGCVVGVSVSVIVSWMLRVVVVGWGLAVSWLAQISRRRLAAWQERELMLRAQSVEDLVEGGLEDG